LNRYLRKAILHILFAAGLILMFTGGPGQSVTRSFRDLWNLGHVVLFFLFVFILRSDWEGFSVRGPAMQWLLALSAAAVLGLATEVLQSFTGRQFDYVDILRDLAGCSVGMLCMNNLDSRRRTGTDRLRYAAVFIILLIVLLPLLFSLADEFIANGQFPVLAGFETPLEINRWRADGQISISNDICREGESSLRAEFTTRRYSRVTMRYSLGEWKGYDYLDFSVFNPDPEDLKLICRIHDEEHHEHGNAYADRFHRQLNLEQGWNSFRIPLNDIRDAPSDREMDLSSIEQLSFFSVSLADRRFVYIDNVRLIRDEGVSERGVTEKDD